MSGALGDLACRYPRLFNGGTEAVPGVVGSGWVPLVDWCLARINELLNDTQASHFELVNIANENGSLAIYYSIDLPAGLKKDMLQEIVEDAQRRSRLVCEDCGSAGALRKARNARTLCEQHAMWEEDERGD